MTNYRVDPSFPASKMVQIKPDDVEINQYYTLADIMGGDNEGTTETDSVTDRKGSGGYSTINSKGGY